MCGLVGFLTKVPANDFSVLGMVQSLIHRGPDASGVWTDVTTGIALGHRRLSILELSLAGNQPMHSACGRYVLVFNGEIYNHLDLRAELEVGSSVQVAWRGHSDTETLLAGFVRWGVAETLKRTVGMFAIAVWDRTERRLFLARDRFGEKPLYYGWSRGAFVFGSELKALRCYPGFDNPIDRDVVALYLQHCYVPAPYAIYRDIYKLEPGCLLSLSLSDTNSPPAQALFAPVRHGGLVIERYWSLSDVVQHGLSNPFADEREAVDQLELTLSNAVRQQSIADVPLGAFLSGGVDSSTIVALMQQQSSRPIRTFTIGFDDPAFNEAHHAKAVARHLGTDHTELYVTPQQAQDVIPLLPHLYCEPFADSSQIPTYLVSKIARQHVTVALSGDAGDELFCGYNRYLKGGRFISQLAKIPAPIRKLAGQIFRMISAQTLNQLAGRKRSRSEVTESVGKTHELLKALGSINSVADFYKTILTKWPTEKTISTDVKKLKTRLDDNTLVSGITDPVLRMMIWDTMSYLPDDILQKVDRAAMGVSLETRVPFLDHRVAELAWRMPLNMKLRDGQGKWALREVLYRHVPRELIERPKAGFGIPVNQWLRGPLRAWAEELLDPKRLAQGGLLEAAPIQACWKEHLAGTHDWTSRLWAVLMFQAWQSSI